ncbi:MAG TPA: DUF4388 domain-containing protein [bacterium]|nr:DUF4388 domain-containing protein [bacterium]
MVVTNHIPLFRMAGVGPLGLPGDPAAYGLPVSAAIPGHSRVGAASAFVNVSGAGSPVGIAGPVGLRLMGSMTPKIEPRDDRSATAAAEPRRCMSGLIDETPLADLLRLLSGSQESGLLQIRSFHGTGRILLRGGRVYFCQIEGSPAVSPRKSLYRMLRWTEGSFELHPQIDPGLPEDRWMSDSTESLLMNGVREMDEINRLSLKTLKPWAPMTADLLAGRLSELSPAELDVLQTVLEHGGLLEAFLDRFPGSDLQALTGLIALIRKGFVLYR